MELHALILSQTEALTRFNEQLNMSHEDDRTRLIEEGLLIVAKNKQLKRNLSKTVNAYKDLYNKVNKLRFNSSVRCASNDAIIVKSSIIANENNLNESFEVPCNGTTVANTITNKLPKTVNIPTTSLTTLSNYQSGATNNCQNKTREVNYDQLTSHESKVRASKSLRESLPKSFASATVSAISSSIDPKFNLEANSKLPSPQLAILETLEYISSTNKPDSNYEKVSVEKQKRAIESTLCNLKDDSRAKVGKYVETVRKQNERATLPGHACEECRRYYEALQQQGIVPNEAEMNDMLQRCSRHKARWSPPSTPDGFWDLSVRTPPDWK